MPCEIKIAVKIEDKNHLNAVQSTLKVETMEKTIRRGKITTNIEGNELIIVINADDLVAGRSLSNSILRLLKTSTDVVNILENDVS